MAHPIVHVEFPAIDHEAAAHFYAEMFGWSMQSFPEFAFTMFDTESGPGGGFATINGDSVQAGTVIAYIETDDIDATLAQVRTLGGQVVSSRQPIPGYGWFGVFTDPSGNRVALFAETGAHQTPLSEPGQSGEDE